MKTSRLIALGAPSLLLASCGGGGGGGGGVASAPPPAPAPPASAPIQDKLIAAVTTTQTFPSHGAALYSDGGLTFSFDAATGKYRVSTPFNTEPAPVSRNPLAQPPPGQPYTAFIAEGVDLKLRASGEASGPLRYSYANLAAWGYPRIGTNFGVVGHTAFAQPTATMPRTGSASYQGFIEGASSETYLFEGIRIAAPVSGGIALTADFATATLTGTMTPQIEYETAIRDLGTLSLTRPVWQAGSANFTEPLPQVTPLTSPIVWGTFAGPAAQEIAGGFLFDYLSSVSGKLEQAGGAFLAKQGQ